MKAVIEEGDTQRPITAKHVNSCTQKQELDKIEEGWADLSINVHDYNCGGWLSYLIMSLISPKHLDKFKNY